MISLLLKDEFVIKNLKEYSQNFKKFFLIYEIRREYKNATDNNTYIQNLKLGKKAIRKGWEQVAREIGKIIEFNNTPQSRKDWAREKSNQFKRERKYLNQNDESLSMVDCLLLNFHMSQPNNTLITKDENLLKATIDMNPSGLWLNPNNGERN